MRRTPHAVLGAYQYADLTRPCPHCGAGEYITCKQDQNPDIPRHLPCIARLKKAAS